MIGILKISAFFKVNVKDNLTSNLTINRVLDPSESCLLYQGASEP